MENRLSSQPSVECSRAPLPRWILLQFLRNSPTHQPHEFQQVYFCLMIAAEVGVALVGLVALLVETVLLLLPRMALPQCLLVLVLMLMLLLHHQRE